MESHKLLNNNHQNYNGEGEKINRKLRMLGRIPEKRIYKSTIQNYALKVRELNMDINKKPEGNNPNITIPKSDLKTQAESKNNCIDTPLSGTIDEDKYYNIIQ